MPIINDFDVFIEYLIANKMSLGPSTGFIPPRHLFEINKMVSLPMPDVTPRTNQPLFPLLHMFYHIILAGKLFHVASQKNGKMFLEPTERLELYKALKPAEKYFFLLETLWVDVDWRKLDRDIPFVTLYSSIEIVLDKLDVQKPGTVIEFNEYDFIADKNLKYLKSRLAYLNLFLLYFSFFGFWKVTKDPEFSNAKSEFFPKIVILEPLGIAIGPILVRSRCFEEWNIPYRKSLSDKVLEYEEPFFEPFVHLFSKGQLQKTLPRVKQEFIDGTYIFKVSLSKDTWRRIAIPADCTFEDLHLAIQRAFDFDNDHLYSFFLDGKLWSSDRLSSPYEDKGPYVDKVMIGKAGLYIRQRILYLFDYGDRWMFDVVLEGIRDKGNSTEPRVIESKGESPEQYPNYEDLF